MLAGIPLASQVTKPPTDMQVTTKVGNSVRCGLLKAITVQIYLELCGVWAYTMGSVSGGYYKF